MHKLETFENGFEKLQQRYDGAVAVVDSDIDVSAIHAEQFASAELPMGFVDISMKPQDLGPFMGRIVLSPDRSTRSMMPAVITKKDDKLQMSRLEQPFDPGVGVTDGIKFALGLKNETAQSSFGAHIAAGGFEAGHLAPAFIGVVSSDVKSQLKSHGDTATHQVGSNVGGVPEAMITTGLISDINLRTVTLPNQSDREIPLFWHPSLESDEGMQVAQYNGAVRLMLGAATLRLGDAAVDQVGELVDDVIRGAAS